MNMLERFKAIFVSPSRLFSEIKEETDYKPTLMYYFVFVLGLSIVSSVIGLIAEGTAVMTQNTILGWVTAIIGILVFAFFISLVASWFGGTRSWIQGLKAVVYPRTIVAVFVLIMAIILLITPLELTLTYLTSRGAIAAGVIAGFLAVVGVTIVLSVECIAISFNISKGKAFGTLTIAAIFNFIVIWVLSWILTKIGLIKTIVPTV